MKLKHYKKTIRDSKIIFSITLDQKVTDDDQATKFAIATILEATGIEPFDFILYPVKVEI